MKKILLICIPLFTILNAQTMQKSIEEVLSNNPVVLERLKNYNALKEDIRYAKSDYYPKLDLLVGVGYEDINNHDRPTIEDESLSSDVYTSSLNYTQNLFNGFETYHQVKQNEVKTLSAAYSYIEQANEMAFKTIQAYLDVMRNEELLQNTKENIDINENIFIKVQKLYDSGLTTLSEVNKIESSLALAKSNYVVQENTLINAGFNLHKLLGRYVDVKKMTKPVFDILLPVNLNEATQVAMQNNPTLLMNANDIKVLQELYKVKQSPYYPTFDIEISQTFSKNMNAIDGETDKFRAMAFLRYNIFNGYMDSSSLQKSRSEIHKGVEKRNILRRDVIEKLNLSWAAYEKLEIKLQHLEKYKEFSKKTLTLYIKEYDLGRRSLLDLLAAQNDFIASEAQIITAEYGLLFAKYRILHAMGVLIPSVVDSESLYADVGLFSPIPDNNDNLPVKLDKDNDLIVDDKDICSNSISGDMLNIYGCKEILENIDKIQRFNTFLFDNSNITDETKVKFNAFVQELKAYGFENLEFDVFGNVDIEGMTETQLVLLSKKRANIIKDMLIEAGAIKEKITIYAQGNKAPLYTNESSRGRELNNRVDISVKKLKRKYESKNNTKSIIAPVIIVATLSYEDKAYEFAKEFKNIDNTEVIVEFANNHYNIKLLVNDKSKVKSILTMIKDKSPDAWYAGEQIITVDTI
jgi:adhesin transport system outer membrane protein